jgi:hypothetical protein
MITEHAYRHHIGLFWLCVQKQFRWDGYMQIGQLILFGIAVLFFFLGGRHYDARQVLGIKQIKE